MSTVHDLSQTLSHRGRLIDARVLTLHQAGAVRPTTECVVGINLPEMVLQYFQKLRSKGLLSRTPMGVFRRS